MMAPVAEGTRSAEGGRHVPLVRMQLKEGAAAAPPHKGARDGASLGRKAWMSMGVACAQREDVLEE